MRRFSICVQQRWLHLLMKYQESCWLGKAACTLWLMIVCWKQILQRFVANAATQCLIWLQLQQLLFKYFSPDDIKTLQHKRLEILTEWCHKWNTCKLFRLRCSRKVIIVYFHNTPVLNTVMTVNSEVWRNTERS